MLGMIGLLWQLLACVSRMWFVNILWVYGRHELQVYKFVRLWQIQTVAVGAAIGQACLLLAAGDKGMRYMMPHATGMSIFYLSCV